MDALAAIVRESLIVAAVLCFPVLTAAVRPSPVPAPPNETVVALGDPPLQTAPLTARLAAPDTAPTNVG